MLLSTAAIIERNGRVLFVKRRPRGDLADMWELPGGKVEEDEDSPISLKRELREELGIEAIIGSYAGETNFTHHGSEFTLYGYYVDTDLTGLELREHTDLTWCSLVEALSLDLVPSDRSLITNILSGFR